MLREFSNLKIRFGDADQFRLSRRTLTLATPPFGCIGPKAK